MSSRSATMRHPWGHLPERLRVLFLAGRTLSGRWLNDVLGCDDAVKLDVHVCRKTADGLAALREELFEAVLVTHESGVRDGLATVEAIRGAGEALPVVLLGEAGEDELAAACFELGGDAYVCVNTSTTRSLLWTIGRAHERHCLLEENHALRQAQRQRLSLEHQEANRLLQQQRSMISELERVRDAQGQAVPPLSCPEPLVHSYAALLRNYVIMGHGNLPQEMVRLASLLAESGIAARQVMELHLQALEEILQGLGNRSARHVLTRADMLILEMMSHLADGYRAQRPELRSSA